MNCKYMFFEITQSDETFITIIMKTFKSFDSIVTIDVINQMRFLSESFTTIIESTFKWFFSRM